MRQRVSQRPTRRRWPRRLERERKREHDEEDEERERELDEENEEQKREKCEIEVEAYILIESLGYFIFYSYYVR